MNLPSRFSGGERTCLGRAFLLLLLLVMSCANPMAALAAPVADPLDPAELEGYFDALIPQQLATRHVPGAVVVVVQDGHALFSKGYGLANLETGTPVDPDVTLFRIGSVTKTFVWTAVMQLVEQVKLDLDADVNTYLDFEIPATYPQPIMLRHLMSHTAGFEEANFGVRVVNAEDLVPLGDWLKAHQPARVRVPGTLTAYSNYGANLAGYIIARVSGEGWEVVIERQILEPLGMVRTTPRQPVPAALIGDLAQGYQYVKDEQGGGAYQLWPYDYASCSASGMMSGTGADMARYMIAHLHEGEFEGVRILQPETARQMHSLLFAHDPHVNGFLHGFYQMNQNGQQIYGHAGDLAAYHSLMALFPEHDLGFFVAYNGVVAMLQEETLEAFADRFFPGPSVPPLLPREGALAAGVAGLYHATRSGYTNVEKAVGLLSYTQIVALPFGNLQVNSALGSKTFVQAELDLYREGDTGNFLVLRSDERGKVQYVFENDAPTSALERFSWYEHPVLHQVVLGISYLVLVTLLVAAAVRALRRKPASCQTSLVRWAVRLQTVSAGIALLFIGLFIAAFGNQLAFTQGNVTLLSPALACSTLIAFLALPIAIGVVPVWRSSLSLGRRAHYALGALALLAMTWSFLTWNLVGWRF